jgi:hypothetical protein
VKRTVWIWIANNFINMTLFASMGGVVALTCAPALSNGHAGSDFQILGWACFGIGIVSLVLGIFAQLYLQRWEKQLGMRQASGLCPNCGYDLRASKDRCPECGREIDT